MTILCINFPHVYAKWPLTCQMFVFRYGAVSTLYSYRYFPKYLKFETVIIVNILLTLIREAEHPDLT